MLLASSHISMTFSASIVFLFTSVLFLSGLFLQQQTVRQFHAALATQKAIHSTSSAVGSLPSLIPPPTATNAAYAQLAVDHHEVCSSIMLFSELHRSGSLFDKVLMYPKPWDDVDEEDPQLETTKWLLKVAAERYNVILRPMEPIFDGIDERPEIIYPDAYLWSLTDYARLLIVALPGLVFNSKPLDSALAAIQPSISPISLNTHFLVLQPNATEFATRTEDPTSFIRNNDGHFRKERVMYQEYIKAFDSRDLPTSNTATIISDATYVAINSPSPERYIPRWEFLAHENAPPEGETRNIWEGLYEMYKTERLEVCGLELEKWDGFRFVSDNSGEADELKA